MLSEESRLRIIEAVEKTSQDMGSASLAEGVANLERAIQIFSGVLVHLRTPVSLDAALQKLEIPSDEEAKFISMIENTGKFVNFVMPRLLKHLDVIAMTQPGRPKALTSSEEKDVCDHIGKLYSVGVELGIAKDRAALKFGVSRSTVERAWMDRKSKARGMSFKDIYVILFK
jgi:hypothetical protein